MCVKKNRGLSTDPLDISDLIISHEEVCAFSTILW